MAIAAWRKAIAEFIGAFTLIFIGAGSILAPGGGSLLLVALAHGLAIGVMVSALGRISGGHFNPAVTLGALVGRQIPVRLAVVYWASQLLGALAAAFGLFLIFPLGVWQPSHLGTPALGSGLPMGDIGFGPPSSRTVTPVARILMAGVLTFFPVHGADGTGMDPQR